jgi:hypothetical protein
MPNTLMPHVDYPYCSVINMPTLRRADVPLDQVEHRLQTEAGLDGSLRGRGWTRIPNSQQAEQVINTMVLT